MDRRGFLTIFIGAAAGLALANETSAAMTLAKPALPSAMTPQDAVLTEDDARQARIERARVYYRRRRYYRPRRRVVVVRRYPYYYRRYYGPRYVYRPRYYYRPRVYWGPRIYRRYWW